MLANLRSLYKATPRRGLLAAFFILYALPVSVITYNILVEQIPTVLATVQPEFLGSLPIAESAYRFFSFEMSNLVIYLGYLLLYGVALILLLTGSGAVFTAGRVFLVWYAAAPVLFIWMENLVLADPAPFSNLLHPALLVQYAVTIFFFVYLTYAAGRQQPSGAVPLGRSTKKGVDLDVCVGCGA